MLSLFTAPSRPQTHRATYRPMLEALENRLVPAAPVGGFLLANLVSNEPGVAVITDAELVNAWGLALNPGGGALWVSANGTDVSTLYTGDFTRANGTFAPLAKSSLTVTIPGGSPTGQVFNPTQDFVVTNGTTSARAIFIFASDTGFITGWNPGVAARAAQVAVDNEGEAVYTGLALASNAVGNHLYAADFLAGTIDVFDGEFGEVTLSGDFTDPGIKAGFKPFNIQNLGGELYVTYARDTNNDGIPNGGNGFVSVFDTDGEFLRRVASGGVLNQPWGVALAPDDFGPFGGALLVGNHGNGKINAFDPETGVLLGVLRDADLEPIQIDGLWGLNFGNGVSFGDRNALYFSAGPDGGANGLIGSLRFPEDDAGPAAASSQATLTDIGNVANPLPKVLERLGDLPRASADEVLAVLAGKGKGEQTKSSLGALVSAAAKASVLDEVFGQDLLGD